jgi:hypothetical protein
VVRLAKLPDMEPKKQSWKLRVCSYCYNEFVGCSQELLVSMHIISQMLLLLQAQETVTVSPGFPDSEGG